MRILYGSILGLIKQINDGMLILVNRNLREWNLTFSQMQVLSTIRHMGGSATQRSLEKALQVSHPTITGLVSRLEKNHFVSTATDPKDRRNKIVTLTDLAEKYRLSMEKSRPEKEALMLDGLSPEDTEALKKYLLIIRSNICKNGEDNVPPPDNFGSQ